MAVWSRDKYYEIAGNSVTLWDMNKYYYDNTKIQFQWPLKDLREVKTFIPKRINKVCNLKDGTCFKQGKLLYAAKYKGLEYWIFEVSALVDKQNNKWEYGFIFTYFEGKPQYRDLKKINGEGGTGRVLKFFTGAQDDDRAVLKKVCKPTPGVFPTTTSPYGKLDDHIDKVSDSLVSVLRQMIDSFKISEIYVNSMIRDSSKLHKAKKAIDIGKIVLPGGTIDYSTDGYNILKTERDKIAIWLLNKPEIDLIWDQYQLCTRGVASENKWIKHTEDYGKQLLDHDDSQGAVKKYLLDWAKDKDEAKKVILTAENSEISKINKLSDIEIKRIFNEITHRHHLHLNTIN